MFTLFIITNQPLTNPIVVISFSLRNVKIVTL